MTSNFGAFFDVVNAAPLIVVQSEHDIDALLPNEPALRFINFSWHQKVESVLERHRQLTMARPNDRLVYLINDPDLATGLMRTDVESVFLPSYVFVDESIFTPRDSRSQLAHRAVYNARMTPWKRHELASRVDRMLFVGGVHNHDDSIEYFDRLRIANPKATFTHQRRGEFIDPSRVAEHLRSAQVGLCLSAVEGAMFACCEYLLTGLPVVTTPALGGRMWWIDNEVGRVVAADAESVHNAVEELIERDIDPNFIRTKTLDRIGCFRDVLFTLGQDYLDSSGVDIDFRSQFESKVSPWFFRWRSQDQIVEMLQ